MIDKLKNIITLKIHDTDFDDENEGIVIVKTFDGIKVGICVSKREGADAELWLNEEETKKIIEALDNALKEIK